MNNSSSIYSSSTSSSTIATYPTLETETPKTTKEETTLDNNISSCTIINKKKNRLQVISGHLKKASSTSSSSDSTVYKSNNTNISSNNMGTNNPLTSHILDTTLGLPAVNVKCILFKQKSDGHWVQLLERKTDHDGRLKNLLTDAEFTTGVYKFYFDTKGYYLQRNTKTFYPFVEIVFEIENPTQHYHVPLLLSPYGFSTYRGS